MKRRLLANALLCVLGFIAPQRLMADPPSQGYVIITSSGDSQKLDLKGNTGTFEEIISGSPSTVSIVLKGCMRSATCDTLETNTTTTAAQIRKPTISSVYDYFLVIASWTGGTNVSIRVNATIALAGKGGAGGGATHCSELLDAAASCSTDTTLVANVVGAAPLTSPALLGTPTAPTPGTSDNSTKIATTAYVKNQGYATTSSLAAVATSGSASDLGSGTLPAGRLPNPSSSTLGGVQSLAAVSNNFLDSISTLGVPHASRPACASLSDSGTGCSATLATVATSGSASDLGSGTLGAARFPSFTNHALLFGSGSAGSPNLLSSPTTNCSFMVVFNVTASGAVDPTTSCPGVGVNSASGAVSFDSTYRLTFNEATGGSTATWTLCQITGTCASNYALVLHNNNSGDLTVAKNAADSFFGGGSTVTVPTKWMAWVYQDTANTTWYVHRVPTFSAFGSTGALCSWSTTTGQLSCGDLSGDVTTSASKATTLAKLNVNATPSDYVAGGGTAQAQTATLDPALSANTTGAVVWWLPTAANTAAGPTLAVNGLTAKTITKCGATALVANDLLTTVAAHVIYDGTEWVLQNPQAVSCAGRSAKYTIINQGTTAATGPSANDSVMWEVVFPTTVIGATRLFYALQTADNTSNTYNLALVDTSGALVAQTGATAGTTFAAASNGRSMATTATFNVFEGTVYYLIFTGTATTAKLGGAQTAAYVCANATFTNHGTSSGVWTFPVGIPADATGTFANCVIPQIGAGQ